MSCWSNNRQRRPPMSTTQHSRYYRHNLFRQSLVGCLDWAENKRRSLWAVTQRFLCQTLATLSPLISAPWIWAIFSRTRTVTRTLKADGHLINCHSSRHLSFAATLIYPFIHSFIHNTDTVHLNHTFRRTFSSERSYREKNSHNNIRAYQK